MINTIIFDLGAVLINWDPKHLYRKLFTDEAEIDYFLTNVCTSAWNEEQDAGRSIAEGTDALVAQHPAHEANIRAFYSRWDEMLAGSVAGMTEIFKKLKDSGLYKIYALSNWSVETWPTAFAKYDFLTWFDGMAISGFEGIRKPDPAFYQLLLDRYQIDPSEALFIDDNYRNILAAREMGIQAIHFTSAEELEKELAGILPV